MIELFPYQRDAVEWAKTKKIALLYLDMGLGKSGICVRVADETGAKSVLVVCRAVAISNWRNEFKKFSEKDFDLVISSYESLHKVDASKQFDVLIVDESHYVKEPTARRTQSVLGKTGVVHRAKRSFFLTGTPTPNHAGELWPTLYTFGCTRLNYDGFIERYCTSRVTSYGRQITGTDVSKDKIAELKGMLEPICLRLTKQDVNLELPPIFYQDLVVKPGKVELLFCKSFVSYVFPVDHTDDLVKTMEKEMGIVKGIVDGGFTPEAMKMLEAKSKSIMTLRRYNSMQKVEPVVELISQELEAKAYEKIVIFALHRDTIVNLQEKLSKKFGAVLIFGGSKPSRIEDRVAKFQNPKSTCKVLIAQIQTAGTSLTLTAADQVMFVDQDWTPGNNHQAAARCHRIGQTKPVTVRFVSLADSVDQHITNILKRKTLEIAELTDGLKSRKKEKTILRKPTTLKELL